MNTPNYQHEHWFTLLQQRVAQSSTRAVADELQYSTTSISLILNGKYQGKPDRVAQKVLQQYAKVHCPFSGQTIALHQCQSTAHGKAPTHNPMKMQQWRACQSCPKRPKEQKPCANQYTMS